MPTSARCDCCQVEEQQRGVGGDLSESFQLQSVVDLIRVQVQLFQQSDLPARTLKLPSEFSGVVFCAPGHSYGPAFQY
jgi:hypothetical protein